MAPDRIRRRGKGGTGRSGAGPASFPAPLRAARSPRRHTRSKWDNSGRKPEAAARFRPDIRERAGSAAFPRSLAGRESSRDPGHLLLELGERCRVRGWKRADNQIDSANSGTCEDPRSNQLAQSALQLVPLRRCLAMLRNDQPRPGKAQRGGSGADIEMLRPPSPPRLSYALKLGSGSDPLPPRISGPFTLQRTSKAVLLSESSAPFSGGGSKLRVPTSSPSACGIRACGCAVYFWDGMSAFP